MALVTTPGAANADSMASVSDLDTYCTARGITVTGDKEIALRLGAAYLANQYRDRWVGRRANETQSMPWPRIDGTRGFGYLLLDSDGYDIPSDTIPAQVRDANIAAAVLSLQGVTLEPQRLERGGMIKSKTEGVGPLSESTVWMDGAPVVDRLIQIEGILRGLVTGTPGSSSGNIRLVRS